MSKNFDCFNKSGTVFCDFFAVLYIVHNKLFRILEFRQNIFGNCLNFYCAKSLALNHFL